MTRRKEIEYSQRTKEFFMKRDLNKPLCINTAIEWADKTMIEKACEWLIRGGYFVNSNETIEDFRKAMEE